MVLMLKFLVVSMMKFFFFDNRFMEYVAFDLPQYYPPVPLPPYAIGEVNDLFSWYLPFDLSIYVDSKYG